MSFLRNFGPAVFGGVFILCFEIYYHRKKDDRERENSKRAFWNRENEANNVRRQDISFLNYVNIKTENLPMEESQDEEITQFQKDLLELKGKRILNLKNASNTDLKMQYGPANLPDLITYDENYITLINLLTNWATRLIELEDSEAAIKVLEFGISVGSDSSRMFCMLATEYNKVGTPEKTDNLITLAKSLDSIMKNSIVSKLKTIRKYAQ